MTRTRLSSLAVAALAAAALGAGAAPAASTSAGSTASACPPGTHAGSRSPGQLAAERRAADPTTDRLLRAIDRTGAAQSGCVADHELETYAEAAASQQQRLNRQLAPYGGVLPGQKRAAVEQRAALVRNVAAVPNADAVAVPLGKTPLLANVAGYDSVNGEGLAELAGRVDSLAFDAVHNRLFATVGTGGVWMSTDRAKTWRSIGDGLPTQVNGAVGWTSAGGGTLVLASGEPTAGGNNFAGLGAFWSNDLGVSWHQSTGVPDGAMGFKVAVDLAKPATVYVATSLGLFRSTDAGRTFANAKLPTGACAGRTDFGKCEFANWVTDVVVKAPGGATKEAGGQVLAAVGYRAGNRTFAGDPSTPHSAANGLYRSDTGAPGSFTALSSIYGDGTSPVGFARQERIGRTELGIAVGDRQNHNYVYALVQDAVLFNGGVQGIDAPEQNALPGAANNTAFNGVYVSGNFGSTWTRMADDDELQSPLTESALIGTSQVLLYAPGVQSWYNEWIAPDPSRTTEAGVPTRLVFGLEEIWESRDSTAAQDGVTQGAEPVSFKVIGPYFADTTCLFLSLGLPSCPTTNSRLGVTTTHPDQQSGIWIPDGSGGVQLVVGNDGGTYTQTVAKDVELSKEKWGVGAVRGFHTLLPYDASPSADGTVWMGLQDNGTGKITPEGQQIMGLGGDGFYTAVDPDDSNRAYGETTFGAMQTTADGGKNWSSIDPAISGTQFGNPFVMDPNEPKHLMTAGRPVVETTNRGSAWTQVFDLGSSGHPGEPYDEDTAGTPLGDETWPNSMTAIDLQDDAAYVGFCGVCDILNKDPDTEKFHSGIATNVGGSKPPKRLTSDGWHIAKAAGLPNRFVTSVVIDPKNPQTVYVTLGGYANREWVPPGSYLDKNTNIGKGHVFVSHNAAESFTDLSGDLPDDDVSWLELAGGQLVAGTELGVYISSDLTGRTWAPVRSIPTSPISTIKTTPGNPSRLIVATFGRGVYELRLGTRVAAPAGPPPAVPPPTKGPGSLAATGGGLGIAVLATFLLTLGLLVRRRSLS
jgi:hypothetical protein